MTRKKPLVDELQRRAFAQFDTLNAAGDSDAVLRAKCEIIDLLLQVVSPLAVEAEKTSETNTDNASLPRAELLTRSELCAAADAYAASGGVIIKGWKAGRRGKGGMLEHLRNLYPHHHKIKRWDQVSPRLENAGITEGEIRDRIANWKPKKSR